MAPAELDLTAVNLDLASADAMDVVTWAAATFGKGLVMSTSFGIQSAVMLHLVTQGVPDIPVIWVDTGYLPPQTYGLAEELTERLRLNLQVYQSPMSPARMEALHGKLWSQPDVESLNRYHQLRKVEPMQRALKVLQATAWLAGLRRDQTGYRQTLRRVDLQGERYKVHPILSWSAKDIYLYLTQHDCPTIPCLIKATPLWGIGILAVPPPQRMGMSATPASMGLNKNVASTSPKPLVNLKVWIRVGCNR